MGRVKLKIKRLENTNGRQATYTKRKHGIMKKANELSILCDIDIILLMFSPTGKPSICKGNRSIEEVIAKFAQLTPQERAKRKLESLEALKKTFKKLDHDVNIPDFLGTSSQTIEEVTNQSSLLQDQLSEVHTRLGYWNNIVQIDNLEHLGQLEDSLRESINRIREHKENFGKQQQQQLPSLECTSQFPNGMYVPIQLGSEQHLPSMTCVPGNDGQHVMLHEDPNLLPHRDDECNAGTSFGNYSSYFGAGKSSDLSNSCQESGVSSILNELNGTASIGMQFVGQYPYLPYNLNMVNDAAFQAPALDMNQQSNPVNFHLNGGSGYVSTPGSWGSISGPCMVTMFDENLYSHQPN